MDKFENEVNDKIDSLSKIDETVDNFIELLKNTNRYDIMILGTVEYMKNLKNLNSSLGESYITHPIRLVTNLLNYNPKIKTDYILVALLHNIPEVTDIKIEDLSSKYNSFIANCVSLLLINRELQPNYKISSYLDNYYLNLTNHSTELKLIKLFDKIDNLPVLSNNPNDEVRKDYINEIEHYLLDFSYKQSEILGNTVKNYLDNAKKVGYSQEIRDRCNKNLKKKLALVGGSSSGIGYTIANEYLELGLDVIITSRKGEKLNKAYSDLSNKFNKSVTMIPCDFSKENEVYEFIDNVKKVGYPDIIILNTGGPKSGKFMDIDINIFNETHMLSYLSHIILLREFIPNMQKNKYGRIVNVSSTLVVEPSETMVMSSSYRACLINSLKCLSKGIAKDNITVNSILTGAVLTGRLFSLFKNLVDDSRSIDEIIEDTNKKIPSGYISKPDDYFTLVKYLTLDNSGFVTGTNIVFDGGMINKSF